MMVKIAITKEAHAAIASTIAKERALDELQKLQDGRLWIWLPLHVVRALGAQRGSDESYSDVIMRAVEELR